MCFYIWFVSPAIPKLVEWEKASLIHRLCVIYPWQQHVSDPVQTLQHRGTTWLKLPRLMGCAGLIFFPVATWGCVLAFRDWDGNIPVLEPFLVELWGLGPGSFIFQLFLEKVSSCLHSCSSSLSFTCWTSSTPLNFLSLLCFSLCYTSVFLPLPIYFLFLLFKITKIPPSSLFLLFQKPSGFLSIDLLSCTLSCFIL